MAEADPVDVTVRPASDADFAAFYEAQLRPELQRHDAAVRAANAAAASAAFVAFCVAGLVGFFLALHFLDIEGLVAPVVAGGLAGALIAALAAALVRSSKIGDWGMVSYKGMVVDPVVKFLSGGALEYHPDRGFKSSFIEGLDLIGDFDRYGSEDLIAGKLGATELQAAEVDAVRVERVRDSKGHVTEIEEPVFRGLVLVFDFNKDFSSETFIVSGGGGFLGFLTDHDSGFSAWGKGDRITLEDPDFNRDFKVYSSDPVEARYIFTPDFMARFHALYVRYPDGVLAVFRNGCLILMLSTERDRYEEPGSIWDNLAAARAVAADVDELYAFVNLLNLNTRIWTKR